MNWYDPIVHELPCGSECVPSALKKHQVKCFTCSELANARAKALKDLSNKSLNSLAMFGDDISDSSDEETAVVQVSTQVELQPSNQAGVPQVSPQGGRQPPNQDESTPGDESDEETEVSPQAARQLPTPNPNPNRIIFSTSTVSFSNNYILPLDNPKTSFFIYYDFE